MTKKILSIALVLCTLLSFATVFANAATVDGVALNVSGTVNVATEFQLSATVKPTDEVSQEVTWTSDNENIVVDETGKVTVTNCTATGTVTATSVEDTNEKASVTIQAICDYSKKDTTVSSKMKSAATCTSQAVWYYSCSRCTNVSDSDTFKVKTGGPNNDGYAAHTFVSYNTTAAVEAYKVKKSSATCTAKETWYKYCSVCNTSAQDIAGSENQTFTVGNTIDHDWKKIADEIAPTCKDYGYKAKYECTVCKATKGGEQIAKLTTHTDADNDDYCDCCNKYLGEVVIDSTFKCSMCPTYEAKKDIPFIGVIYEIVHFFVHLIESINDLT